MAQLALGFLAAVATLFSACAAKAADACQVEGWSEAALANAASLETLAWAPFGRAETGWTIYLPLIQREIATECAPDGGEIGRASCRERV